MLSDTIKQLLNSSGSNFKKKKLGKLSLKYISNIFFFIKKKKSCTNDHTRKLAKQDGVRGEFSIEALKEMTSQENLESSEASWFELKEQEVRTQTN